MKARSVFLILLTGYSLSTFSQNSPKSEENVTPEPEKLSINYKDGSFYQGQVVRWEPNHIILKITTGDTITVDRSLITKIKSSKDVRVYRKGSYHLKTGYYGYATLNVGSDDFAQATTQIELIIGKRMTEKWSVGIGYGRTYSDATLAGVWTNHTFRNLFGYGRYYLKNSKVQPYVDAKLGYGFAAGGNDVFFFDPHSGGFNFQPGIGLHFASKKATRWVIGIGQNLQYTRGSNTDQGPFGSPIIADYKLWYNRTVFKIGFEFK